MAHHEQENRPVLVTAILEELQPGIYIGNYKASIDVDLLRSLGITHILGLGPFKPKYPEARLPEFTHLIEDVKDKEDEDILDKLDEMLAFIDEGLKVGKVLVHCQQGISRSAAVHCAYYMRKYKKSLHETLHDLRKGKDNIEQVPNPGFLAQLQLFEDMGYVVDPSYPPYQAFQAARQAISGDLSQVTFAMDPEIEAHDIALAKCKHCSRKLIYETDLVNHLASKANPSATPTSFATKSSKDCFSYSVRPPPWVLGLDESGHASVPIECPSCRNKWMVPGFEIWKHAVVLDGT
ncbi:hypothetical protein BZG36_00550 [Bifiguratus adelaidae]|uniref:Uncharacterized protein n=1 Tax=Bifiguratus adelaidae TaxID=1938954 RepID=A0A261Y774_9FUNG|nr:hypothetical protein BZG36_00550 [Bifiguratus adelaidae]